MNTQQTIVGKSILADAQLQGFTVSVVAWQSTGGAGFDWFYAPSVADRAYAIEKAACDDCFGREVELTMVRFEVTVSSLETATEEINGQLDHLFVQVENPYPRRPSFMVYPDQAIH
ncbi:hypothetical protein [Paraburkholderia sp. SIMBA_054]|uniref:hypothetical protein n=1 Tax=Paraburkholderia sp. SIMBA_054 TaxID=3085795 RepID=UPI00397C9587